MATKYDDVEQKKSLAKNIDAVVFTAALV